MRGSWLALAGVALLGCGGKIAPDASLVGLDGGAADATADAPDARVPPPIPSCSGVASCLSNGVVTEGAIVVTCQGVYYVGYWTLVLEREINGDFRVVQVQTTGTPGFGLTFDDTSAPPAVTQLTYRVCVQDGDQTRCGAPFTTEAAPGCACVPFTCDGVVACNTSLSNGCGGKIQCGACPAGITCGANHSCCPDHQEPGGLGGCECAPTHPCLGATYWDPGACACRPIVTPLPE
jgi:hypothetical protein